VAGSPNRKTARPLPTLGGIEPVNDNAPSADRIVCRGRAGERVVPPRASSRIAVSRRSRELRPPRWAARLQARVGSGSASPPPGRTDSPGQPTVSLPVWPGAPCVCWPTRRCCQVGRAPGEAIRPNFHGTLGRCRRRLESGHPSEDPGASRGSCFGALGHLPAAPLLHCAIRWQTHQTTSLRDHSPRLVA
jgi:hypothetical protein